MIQDNVIARVCAGPLTPVSGSRVTAVQADPEVDGVQLTLTAYDVETGELVTIYVLPTGGASGYDTDNFNWVGGDCPAYPASVALVNGVRIGNDIYLGGTMRSTVGSYHTDATSQSLFTF